MQKSWSKSPIRLQSESFHHTLEMNIGNMPWNPPEFPLLKNGTKSIRMLLLWI